jgi:conjugative transposon protein TcpC
VTSYPLWRLRALRELPRYLLMAASAAGLIASVRIAIAPPRARPAVAGKPAAAPVDRAAEGYAVLFARRYLSWNASEAQQGGGAVEAFAGSGMEAGAGLTPPATGEQHVEWAEVVQVRSVGRSEHVYTVAAQTDTAGLLYLTVGVARRADGRLALAGYPALVGAPAAGPALPAVHLREVAEPALSTVVERALKNYLGASPGELAADLAATARVSLPPLALALESVSRLDWTSEGRSVLALVHAQDARGVHYTLAYELDVERAQGRWEIAAVQMDPDA